MWTMELFRTTDGLRLMELPLTPMSWSRSVRDGHMDADPDGISEQGASGLNYNMDAIGSILNTKEVGWQDRLRSYFMPTKNGFMALYNGVPIVGGPIAPNVDFSRRNGVSFRVDSYLDLLARRYVVPEQGFSSSRQLGATQQQLYSIARYMIEVSMAKPSGALPIVLPEYAFGARQRNWQAFNVSNLSAAKLLEEIGDVQGGPDLDLRPRVNGQRFEFELIHGTDRNPYIGQKTTHDWEEQSLDASGLTATLSSAYVAHRVYAVGDGEDVGTHLGRFDTDIPPEWPLLESVVSDSSITAAKDPNKERLKSLAESVLNPFPVVGCSMTVRADGSSPLGTFWPGELARVTVRGNPGLPDGSYDMRILSMSGTLGNSVNLTFDPMIMEVF